MSEPEAGTVAELALKPALEAVLMVVDEPAQGLHVEELAELVELIHRRAERGRAYLVISHRDELAAACHRHLRVVAGGLEEG